MFVMETSTASLWFALKLRRGRRDEGKEGNDLGKRGRGKEGVGGGFHHVQTCPVAATPPPDQTERQREKIRNSSGL